MSYREQWEELGSKLDRTVEYSRVSTVLCENYRYRNEALQFLMQEVQFGLRLCENLERRELTQFYITLETRCRKMETALECLSAHLEVAFRGPEKMDSDPKYWHSRAFFEYLSLIDRSTGAIAQSIQATANSVVYRRYRGPSGASQFRVVHKGRKVRLSEVHLDYSDTLRGVEALVGHYFSAIQRAYLPESRFGTLCPPILIVASGRSFSFQYFHNTRGTPVVSLRDPSRPGKDAAEMRTLEQELRANDYEAIRRLSGSRMGYPEGPGGPRNVNETLALAQQIMTLSRIVAPRFFPVTVRYAPVLIHELFHPVLYISQLVAYDCQEKSESLSDSQVPSTFREVGKVYGRGIRSLAELQLRLSNAIEAPLSRIARVAGLTTRYDRFYYAGKFYRQGTAMSIANEILADLGSLVLGNISYLCAHFFSCYSGVGRSYLNDPMIANMDHPPPMARFRIMSGIAKQMGYGRVAATLDKMFEGSFSSSREEHSKRVYLDIWEEELINVCQSDLFPDIVNYFSQFTKPTKFFATFREKTDESNPYIYRYREADLLKGLKRLTDRIDDQKLSWDEPGDVAKIMGVAGNGRSTRRRISPTDTMNAMWVQLLFSSPKTGRKRLQWRIALNNDQGHGTGRK